ncbi:carbonic anhydrase [Bordetella genomosp. 9]|nr:carbonic anhydrase family protein [Bordetella genomosp. 9]
MCKLGKEQSPIDIRDVVDADLPAIAFDYRQSVANVINNGHTIQVDLADGGTIALQDGKYKLLQFHFHTPSEERIDGKAYPLVAHLVHRSDAGRLAVVGVLFEVGEHSPLLEKVFSTMSARVGTAIKIPGGIQANALLPAERSYYAFAGSLTTPPCTEGVQWRILKQPMQISAEQLQAFQQLYPMNARPVQPLNGRPVQSGG